MNEIESIKNDELFSPEYKRKKMILWCIRTIIASVLFVVFWQYEWVHWALYVYIPMNLFGLIMIFVMPYYLKKKQKKVAQELNEL